MRKYEEIYSDLLSQITEGRIRSGSLLPSESELSMRYTASRDTVRKALDLLWEAGLIYKVKGKGSVVRDHPGRYSFPIQGLTSFTEMMAYMGLKSTTHVVSIRRLRKKDLDTDAFNHSDLSPDEEFIEVRRVREINGEKVILDIDTVRASIVPEISEKTAEGSLFSYMENDLGLKISGAAKEITVVDSTKEDEELLHMEDYRLIVLVDTRLYLSDGTLFQHSSSRHRPDRFRFVESSRRRSIPPTPLRKVR